MWKRVMADRDCLWPPKRALLTSIVCCIWLAMRSMSSTGAMSNSSLEAAWLHDGRSLVGFEGRRAFPGLGFLAAAGGAMAR